MKKAFADRRLANIFLIVFIDLMGFGLILPLLPFYAQQYQAGATLVGLLVASYAAAQLIGAPILGRLSDRYGRRPVLLISILGTALSLVLLGVAEPVGRGLAQMIFGPESEWINATILAVLFTSRILDGLTGGNISVAQAYITDVTEAKDRARSMGLIGAAFGLGFIIGPAVGGALSSFGYAVPALAAAMLATVNLVGVYRYLPESLTPERRAELVNGAPGRRPAFSLAALSRAFGRPKVGPLLHTRFFFGLAFAIFQTIFSLYAAGAPLNLSAQSTGFLLTYVGVLAALVQGVAVGKLTERFDEIRLIFLASLLMAVSLLGWAFTPNVWVLMVVLAPLALAGGVLNTVLSSTLSKSVDGHEVGGILGLSASLESMTRVLAPSIGGVLLASFGAPGPAIFSTLIMLWVVSFVWRRLLPASEEYTTGAGMAVQQGVETPAPARS